MARWGKSPLALHIDRTDRHYSAEFEADWQLWVRQVEALYRRWRVHLTADDPFAYNETASASLLASAAVQTGGLAIAEFHTEKRRPKDEPSTGRWSRGDLWIRHPSGERWAIELKQLMPTAESPATVARVTNALTRAKEDAKQLSLTEARHRLGYVVVSTYWRDGRSDPDSGGHLERASTLAPWSARFGDERSHVLILLARHDH